MKKTKILTVALAVSMMMVLFTACGNPVKEDFKDYINNNVTTSFIPENNAVVEAYTNAIQTQDATTIITALTETIPAKNDAFLEKLKAYKPETTEVQELHNIFIKATEIRKEGYVKMLAAFHTNDETATSTAIAKLDEADAKFTEYVTKIDTMKKELGLVDAD